MAKEQKSRRYRSRVKTLLFASIFLFIGTKDAEFVGQFYPAEKEELKEFVKDCIKGAKVKREWDEETFSIISPHAGYIYSGKVAGAAYRQIEAEEFTHILLIGESHRKRVEYAALPPWNTFSTPLGMLAVDEEGIKMLERKEIFKKDADLFHKEHTLEVQLPFIYSLKNVKILPIILGGRKPLFCKEVADSLVSYIKSIKDKGGRIIIVTSTDFSHYLPKKIASRMDEEAINTILSLDIEDFFKKLNKGKIQLCGAGAVAVMMHLAKIFGIERGALLSYATSAEVTGDESSVVGYAAIGFFNEKELYRKRREEMVEKQIIARGVKDKNVIKSMLEVRRHHFVPKSIVELAYSDTPLPIGEGQTISQPYIVAFMTEALSLKGNEKVLEIGTGSGYHAAVLSRIAKEVYTIEIIPSLSLTAQETIKRLGYKNIYFKIGDGYEGWKEHAPFDAIIVTCAPAEIPKALVEQLKDGGKMVVPVGKYFQKLKLIEKKNGKIIVKDLLDVRFVPMIKKKPSPE